VLIRLSEGASLTPVIQKWKGSAAREINQHHKRVGTIWAPDYYDRCIRDQNHLYDSIACIYNNPVKAGLCDKCAFSSKEIQRSAD
jgi:putative transposase